MEARSWEFVLAGGLEPLLQLLDGGLHLEHQHSALLIIASVASVRELQGMLDEAGALELLVDQLAKEKHPASQAFATSALTHILYHQHEWICEPRDAHAELLFSHDPQEMPQESAARIRGNGQLSTELALVSAEVDSEPQLESAVVSRLLAMPAVPRLVALLSTGDR